jgi:hypothetical protein
MWTLIFGHHRTPTHGYEATREDAMATYDDEAEPTGSSNFVLRRDRDRPRRGWHPRDAMQSMAIRGFVAHNRKSGAYALTDSGRAALTAILEGAP